MRRSRPRLAVTALALSLLGCSPASTGQELGTGPSVGQQLGPINSTAALAEIGNEDFEITSPAFAAGEQLPERFTFDGDQISPPLTFSPAPAGTAELALVVTDVSNDNHVHWALTAIPASATGFVEGEILPGVVEHRNSSGSFGWDPPPGPDDGRDHHYRFELFALPAPIGLPADLDPTATVDTIRRVAITRSSILALNR